MPHVRTTYLLKYQSMSCPDTICSRSIRAWVGPVLGRCSGSLADGAAVADGSDSGVGACGTACAKVRL